MSVSSIIEASIVILLIIMVLASALSLMGLTRNIRITAYNTGSGYETKVCLNNTTPLNVAVAVNNGSMWVNSGSSKCLTVTSGSMPSNITLDIGGLINVTLGVSYG